jgi:hypothetical protein
MMSRADDPCSRSSRSPKVARGLRLQRLQSPPSRRARATKVRTTNWTKPDGTTVTLDTYRGTANLNADKLRAFQNAKDADASHATELAKTPKLVANDSSVAQHPALQHFLEQYPTAREEIQANSGNFLTPTQGSNWNASTIGKTSGAKSE